MTTTPSAYLQVTQNLPRMQAMTAAETAVKNATAYYTANIGAVKTIDDLVGNYRLLSYALAAHGLSDQINSTALIRQVLSGGDASSAATTVLAGIVSSNADSLSSTSGSGLFSESLLTSLQGFNLGG